MASSYKTYKSDEDTTKNNTYKIQKPNAEIQRKGVNYSYLGTEPFDEDEFEKSPIIRVGKRNISGIIPEGTKVRKGDVIIGKITIEKIKGEEVKRRDCSLVVKAGEEGTIARVYLTKTQKGQKLVKVVIQNVKIPEIGDKFAARSAQKGTCGMIVPQVDMPFNENTGMSPDMVINSHCLSGDTIIQLTDGSVCEISSLYTNEDVDIVTVNPETLSVSKTKFTNGFKKMPDKMYKIKTISGREVKCTPEHKFLVIRGGVPEWVECERLRLYEDKMLVSHSAKHCA